MWGQLIVHIFTYGGVVRYMYIYSCSIVYIFICIFLWLKIIEKGFICSLVLHLCKSFIRSLKKETKILQICSYFYIHNRYELVNLKSRIDREVSKETGIFKIKVRNRSAIARNHGVLNVEAMRSCIDFRMSL